MESRCRGLSGYLKVMPEMVGPSSPHLHGRGYSAAHKLWMHVRFEQAAMLRPCGLIRARSGTFSKAARRGSERAREVPTLVASLATAAGQGGVPAAPAASPAPLVTTSTSTVKKTLKKDIKAMEDRMARFDVKSVFPGVPKMKPLSELQVPTTKMTTLENGLRVATQETYGPLCTFGVVVDAGSRDEEPGVNDGVCHLLEAMSFKSTANRSHQQLVHELDDLGAIPTANSSREQVLLSLDVLRHSLPEAMELLADVVMNPVFAEEEVEDAKAVLELQLATLAPELLIKELVQQAAYSGQSLGRPHLCSPESMHNLTSDKLRHFKEAHYTAENMVLAAAGVDHDDFVRLADKHLGRLPRGQGRMSGRRVLSSYTGGEARLELPQEDGLTRVAVAFELAGWQHEDLVPMCVLQILLGGGDSFSAGGPGKGMYSRLYRELLNKYHWVEGAEAFVNIHNETGILGIAGSCEVNNAARLMHEICGQICKLALVPVDPTELSRARNMLKCNVLTQLESRIILFEDVGRQIVTYGHRESPESVCRKIDSVTAIDVMRLARTMLLKPVSIASLGGNLEPVPTYQQVLAWFTPKSG